jgi:hypothetical protein
MAKKKVQDQGVSNPEGFGATQILDFLRSHQPFTIKAKTA